MRLSTEYKWQTGDSFFKSDNPKKIYHVRKVKGDTIFYSLYHNGAVLTCKNEETNNWVIVER